MDETVRLNDGTVLHPASAMLSDLNLWIYIDQEMTLAEAFALLNNPAKTAVIASDSFDTPGMVAGYTELFSIRKEMSGTVTAGLRKVVG